ncbi:hypothetical protein DTO282F9_1564 [Paecilomyces variotii]|nr:hypothetical protein DTO282F9_1564 [Paecilomyces variotii]
MDDVVQKPYSYVKQKMKLRIYKPSFISELFQKGELSPEEDVVVKSSAVSLYTGGRYYEINRVIDSARLPGPDDRPNLPYIDAIVKEVLRWHSVASIRLAHMTTEDDIVEGYHIPKGAYLFLACGAFSTSQRHT